MIGDDSQMRTRTSLLIRLRQDPTDQRAWNEFAQQYGRLILAWCQQWGLQSADADDVSQNVLLKLAHHLRSFVYDPGRRFRGFLRTMLITHARTISTASGVVRPRPTRPCTLCSTRSRRGTIWQRDWKRPSTWSGSRWRRQRPATGRATHLGGLSLDGAGGQSPGPKRPLCSTCRSARSSRRRAKCSRCSAKKSNAWKGTNRYG